jgi:hypothetical protein
VISVNKKQPQHTGFPKPDKKIGSLKFIQKEKK